MSNLSIQVIPSTFACVVKEKTFSGTRSFYLEKGEINLYSEETDIDIYDKATSTLLYRIKCTNNNITSTTVPVSYTGGPGVPGPIGCSL